MRRRQYLIVGGSVLAAFTGGITDFKRVAAQEEDADLFEQFVTVVQSFYDDSDATLVEADHGRLLVDVTVTTGSNELTESTFHEEVGSLVGAFAGFVGEAEEPPPLGLRAWVYSSVEDAEAALEAGNEESAPEELASYAANSEWAREAYETGEMDPYAFDVLLTIDPPPF